MQFPTYEEWYILDYQQKQLEKLESAFDTLDVHNNVSNFIDKESMVEEVMQSKYEFEYCEYYDGGRDD